MSQIIFPTYGPDATKNAQVRVCEGGRNVYILFDGITAAQWVDNPADPTSGILFDIYTNTTAAQKDIVKRNQYLITGFLEDTQFENELRKVTFIFSDKVIVANYKFVPTGETLVEKYVFGIISDY